MKKMAAVALALGLVLGGQGSAQAIDFKIRGAWQFSFDYINGGNFMGKDRQGRHTIGNQWAAVRQQRDNFEAMQRLHLTLVAQASENLSGTVFFEIGEQRWGQGSSGGALGADGQMVKLKQAYIDWVVPDTNLKFRMGIQKGTTPGFAMESNVLVDDVAGITASWKFNEHVGVTAMWYRLLNDNYVDSANPMRNSFMDNFDLFGLVLPFTFDGLDITPWGMGGAMGPNSIDLRFRKMADGSGGEQMYLGTAPNPAQGIDGQQLRDGLYPAAYTTGRSGSSVFSDEYSTMWWAGLTGKWTGFDPLRISFDFTYGSVDHNREYLNRHGWFGMLLAEYAMDWGLPGLYGWYMSGDDDNPHNGSERMPYLTTTNSWMNTLSTFGFRGNPIIGGGKGEINVNPTGTWGVGARIRNFTPWDYAKLSHTIVFNVFGGTNSPKMANYITGRHGDVINGRNLYRNNTDFNSFGTYLTTADSGLEINFDTKWKAEENLTFFFNTGYIHLWLDDGVWGRYGNQKNKSLNYKDAWEASMNIVYSF